MKISISYGAYLAYQLGGSYRTHQPVSSLGSGDGGVIGQPASENNVRRRRNESNESNAAWLINGYCKY